MALYLCVRSLNVKLDISILSDVSRVIAPLLGLWGLFRVVDIVTHDAASYMFMRTEEAASFWLEMVLLVILPVALLSQRRVRETPQYLHWTCAVVVMGFMTNRLNVSIAGLQASSGVYYVPKWTEFACTLAVIAAMICVFRLAVIYLDILPKNATRTHSMVQGNIAQA